MRANTGIQCASKSATLLDRRHFNLVFLDYLFLLCAAGFVTCMGCQCCCQTFGNSALQFLQSLGQSGVRARAVSANAFLQPSRKQTTMYFGAVSALSWTHDPRKTKGATENEAARKPRVNSDAGSSGSPQLRNPALDVV